MKALVFHQFGGPEVLSYADIATPTIQADEVLVRMKAVGLNFADVYRRKGNYHLVGEPPYVLGYEGAGIIEAVGTDITSLQIGDRIAFADVPHANAEFVAVPSEKAIPLPDSISFETAASIMLQGLTAHYLVHDSYMIQPGDVAVVHAAAGGVGQLLTQMIQLRGGSVLGLTSSEEKKRTIEALGAKYACRYDADWVTEVHAKTDGAGADVVYDSVGSTLRDSFEATRIGGTVVFYGMAGGDPEPIDPRMLMDTSKTLTGGDLWNVLTSREERVRRANELFSWVQDGALLVQAPTTFALSDGASAHRLLESRQSQGKILLFP
ncbi:MULTISPECIES: quinone oxidoreductase family protein [Exiguobacterium]|uniref:quinone oxidoreductase family protein n=1 Tax=Exiguobacterium TaxID=33986 RepID=UPI001BE8D9BE|nr:MULTISPECIES: quinone oxidoreductase [Exiguobacterium]MCT4777031.1 quinone oxidoreductase [Exiguobacterium aquaticum]MCT4789447.1 quinone oxidoreductase [Exiguobacterium mexicanum]